MATEAFIDALGNSYEVDWASVYRLIRSYARSAALYQNARVERESHWIGPDLVNVVVDWPKVRSQTERYGPELYEAWCRGALSSMPDRVSDLRMMVEETAWYNTEFQRMMQDSSREFMANLNTHVSRMENVQKGLEITRDLSAETVLIGASILSGGGATAVFGASVSAGTAGAAALGTGALLKGAAKWEDTGHWQSGVFTASSELLFGALKLKVAADVAGKVISKTAGDILVMVVMPKAKIGMEVLSKSVVDGKSFQEGILSGTLKSSDPAILQLAKLMARPGAGGKISLLSGLAVLAAGGIKLARDKAAASAAKAASNPKKPLEPASVPHKQRLIDAAVFNDDLVDRVVLRRYF